MLPPQKIINGIKGTFTLQEGKPGHIQLLSKLQGRRYRFSMPQLVLPFAFNGEDLARIHAIVFRCW